MAEIVVRLGSWGWQVEAGRHAEYFRTGAQAERRARELATALASRGLEAVVCVHDLQGHAFARLTYPPAPVPA